MKEETEGEGRREAGPAGITDVFPQDQPIQSH